MDAFFKGKKAFLMNVPLALLPQFLPYQDEGKPPYSVIFAFADTLDEMAKILNETGNLLRPEGTLLIAYPKLANKLGRTGIHRDHIFPTLMIDEATGYYQNTTLRFNAMRSFDENYTVLAIKKDEKQKARSGPSMRVIDYENDIHTIELYLKDSPVLAIFNQLTPGYKRGWARYIYSTKVTVTRERRLEEMKTLLLKGIKSKDLVRKG